MRGSDGSAQEVMVYERGFMASQEMWSAVDDYLVKLLLPPDAVLDAALKASSDAGLPQIAVSPTQGKFLHLLAKIRGAKKILEIGTLGGYSTIWLARALPADGKLITLEYAAKHADVARANLKRAGVADKTEVIVGPAIESLPTLLGRGPFDLVFIGADKVSTPSYFEWAMKLTKSGSVIIVDNVIRKGSITDAKSTDENVRAIRNFNEMLSKEARVTATTLQTVGSKGYDGFAIAVVN
jgi:predicted O-methyltransferase YrrM